MIRSAIESDTPQILRIIAQAKEQLRLSGSPQWQDGYPAPEHIARDLEREYGWVLTFDGAVIAYAAVIFDGEPAYDSIQGAWIGSGPYAVVHRLAVADEMKHRGVATEFMRRIETLSRQRGAGSLRADTHPLNIYMQRLLASQGLTLCGEVDYGSSPRLAYEKILG